MSREFTAPYFSHEFQNERGCLCGDNQCECVYQYVKNIDLTRRSLGQQIFYNPSTLSPTICIIQLHPIHYRYLWVFYFTDITPFKMSLTLTFLAVTPGQTDGIPGFNVSAQYMIYGFLLRLNRNEIPNSIQGLEVKTYTTCSKHLKYKSLSLTCQGNSRSI